MAFCCLVYFIFCISNAIVFPLFLDLVLFVKMLVNRDTWSLIEQDASGFQSLPLCNSQIIVHAHDFCNHVIYLTNHPIHYGGDYSQLRSDFKAVLNTFDQCKIRPIFVFGGVSVSRVCQKFIFSNHTLQLQ